MSVDIVRYLKPLLWVLTLCSGPNAFSAELHGIVRDSGTLQPIGGVSVSVAGFDQMSRRNAQGEFFLSVPNERANDEVAPTFAEERYWEKSVSIGDSDTKFLDVLLQAKKQRLIVTTDIGGEDPEDEQSIVHMLVASNEFELEGFVIGYAWLDDYFRPKDLSLSIIKAYEECLPSLRTHADGYPSGDYLRSILA